MKIYAYSGLLTRDDLQIQIRFDEDHDLELVDCTVFTDKENKPCTACHYKEVTRPAGELPEPIYIVIDGESKPTDAGALLFTDTIVIENRFSLVGFYR